MKTCTSCKQTKNVEDFNIRNKITQQRQAQCRDCQKAAMKRSYNNKKAQYISKVQDRTKFYYEQYVNWKDNVYCVECGESHRSCIELHHLDPSTKEGNPSSLFSAVGKKKFREELQKCVILCANCHRKAHDNVLVVNASHLEKSAKLYDQLIIESYTTQ